MFEVEVKYSAPGIGMCALHKKKTAGYVVSFKDGTVEGLFLGHKAIAQLVDMKFATLERAQAAETTNGAETADGEVARERPA
jgi:hypothetical protein